MKTVTISVAFLGGLTTLNLLEDRDPNDYIYRYAGASIHNTDGKEYDLFQNIATKEYFAEDA